MYKTKYRVNVALNRVMKAIDDAEQHGDVPARFIFVQPAEAIHDAGYVLPNASMTTRPACGW